MAVRHGVIDADKHFMIDPVTRTIKNQSGKLVLIQYDHNSERFTFECPRFIDDHDMSLCDRVEIHFINTGTGNARSTGVYETDDLQISADNENVVTCSWLISQNATRYVGKLNFIIRFACIADDATIEYAWNTGIYSDIAIAKSIYNGEEFVEDYIDVLELWKQDLYMEGLKITSVEQTVTSTEDSGTNIVEFNMTDGSVETVKIQNGSKGNDGSYITSVELESSEGSIDTYVIKMSDGNEHRFQIYNGVDGVSVTSVDRTSGDGSAGSVDTYTVTLSNGESSDFQVYNGKDGNGGFYLDTTSNSQTGAYLTDIDTGSLYKLYVEDGVLTAKPVESIEGAVSHTGIYLTDVNTSLMYKLYVQSDNLMMEQVDATSTEELNMSYPMDIKTYDPQGKSTDIFAYVDDAVQNVDTPGTGIWYGSTSTDASVADKVVNTETGDFELTRGSRVGVKFLTNTESCLTLDVDGTGAIGIRASNTESGESSTNIPVVYHNLGQVLWFTYDGTYFIVDNSMQATEDTVGSVYISDSVEKTSSSTAASSTAVKAAYDKALEALAAAGDAGDSSGTADDTFYATYGTTTSAEINEAYVAGKKIYCLTDNGGIAPLYEQYDATNHCFYKGGSYFYCINDTWTEEDLPYEDSSNKVTSITSESTDEQYPSAKAVYDFVSTNSDGSGTTTDITIDTEMSDDSTNAVQNKVIKAYIDNKSVDVTVDTEMSDTSTNAVQNSTVKAYVDSKAITIDTAVTEGSTNAVQNGAIKTYVDQAIADAMGDVDAAIAEINSVLGGS